MTKAGQSASDFFNTLRITDIQDVVAADEGLANVTLALAVDPFFSVEELEVHVAVKGDECAFVLHAPLQFDDYRLVNEIDQEGLRVDRDRLGGVQWLGSRSCCHLRCHTTLFLKLLTY